MRIVVGSSNRAKGQEIRELLQDAGLDVLSLTAFPRVEPVPETGTTFAQNARLKALGLARQIGEWVLADDSGLEVDALDGRPGVHSARYGGEGLTDADRAARLLDEMRHVPEGQRTARFQCAVVLADRDKVLLSAQGTVEGRIAAAPAGSSGFGYDPVFVPVGHDRTFAQLGAEVKQSMSHRARALAELKDLLTDLKT